MRIAFTLYLIPISNLLYSQNNFAKQLSQIIKDSTTHFSNFRGDFKEMHDNDSVFYSTITLEGTRENDVLVSQVLTQYRSEIIDSVNERKGKIIVEEWYKKLVGVLGGKFIPEKTRIISWSPVKYGWSFKNGETWIDISLLPVSVDSARYFVSLGVTRFSENVYKLR